MYTDMNIRIFLLAFALAGAIKGALQAEELPDYVSSVRNESIRLDSGMVSVSFTLDLGNHIVDKQHKRIVTPVIISHDGNHEVALPPIIANGRMRAIKDRTKGLDRAEAEDAYRVLTGNREENRLVDYHATVAYQPWMDNARLSLLEEVTGCNCGGLLASEQVLEEKALYAPSLQPSAETHVPRTFTPRSEERDAFLFYPVNQTRLYPERYGNAGELAKIDSALQFVQDNPAYQIQHIYINGYASPEGRLNHNRHLAEGRAEALKQYVLSNYQLPDTLLEVTRGDENWEDLAKAVEQMEIPNRDALLAIIRSDEEPDRREARLKQEAPDTYLLLLRSVYPTLRKNTFRISYISRERTPEETRRLAEEQPQELNAYEFYTVANTYCRDDKQAYGDLVLRAADTYPQNAEANNNAARTCLLRGDLERAGHYLDRTNNEPFTWNNRAVLLWRKGQQQEALLWLRKAIDAGDTQAKENLREIEKRGM